MGAELMAARDVDGQIWANVRRMCKGIGLSENQTRNERRKIQTDKALVEGGANLPLLTDGGNQEVLCLKLDYVPLWLAKITITSKMERESPELVQTLLQYQLRAKDILAAAFIKPINAGASGTQPLLTPEQGLRALELLAKIRRADRPIAIRILAQLGLNVAGLDVLPLGQAANAGDAEDPAIVREFLADILPRAKWSLMPFSLLHDLYSNWLKRRYPGILPCSKTKLTPIVESLAVDFGWASAGRGKDGQRKVMRPGKRMCGPEPLILEFECKDWYNPKFAATYHGIYRI